MVPIVYLFLTSFYGGTIVAVIRVKFRAFFDFLEKLRILTTLQIAHFASLRVYRSFADELIFG